MHRAILALFVLIVIAVLPDIYISRTVLKGQAFLVRMIPWIPLLFLAGMISLAYTGHYDQMKTFSVIGVVLLCFFIPSFLYTICSVIGRITTLKSAGDIVGAALAGLFLAISISGLSFGWKKVSVREIELSFDNLPQSFDGFKIAQLSDWHLGTYTNSVGTIQKEVEKVLQSKADIITFTGDVVNADPREMEPFMEVLSKLKDGAPVFSVMGNHDYCMYHPDPTPGAREKNIEKVQQNERSLGWTLLLNENRIITNGQDSIAIIGVENDGEPPFPQYGDLPKAQEGIPQGTFKVLLSHEPTHWRREVLPKSDIDLTLSGHTHAAQFRIGRLSPSRWIYKEWEGLYQEGDRKLYVSSGAGGNIPFRFGAWPEVVIITLRKK